MASSFENVLFLLLIQTIGIACESIEVADKMLQVVVVHVRFEAKRVFESNGVRGDQVEAVDLGEEVLFAEFSVFLVSLVDVDPDQTCKILRCKGQLRPVLAAVIIAFISSRAAEAKGQTNNETKDGEQKLIDADC